MTVVSDQVVAATVFRETLAADSEIQTEFALAGGVKIFWEHVPDHIEMPFIVMFHILGGSYNRTQHHAIETQFKIVAYTTDIAKAAQYSNALHRVLHRQEAVITTYAVGNLLGNPEYSQYGDIRQTLPIFERDPLQNVPLFQIGGIFEIKLIENVGE